jgi:hypothetical protein
MSPNIATNAIGINSNQVIAGAHAAAQSYSRLSAPDKRYRKIRSREMAMSISLFPFFGKYSDLQPNADFPQMGHLTAIVLGTAAVVDFRNGPLTTLRWFGGGSGTKPDVAWVTYR